MDGYKDVSLETTKLHQFDVSEMSTSFHHDD